MAEPLLMRRSLVGGTLETTKGTAATVSAAFSDTVTYNASANILNPVTGERQPDGHYGGEFDAERGALMAEVTFMTEWRYGDATQTLVQACGLYEYDSGGNPDDMRPTLDLSQHKTITLKVWEDGRLKTVKGCMGTFSIASGNGERIMISWRFIGVPVIATDTFAVDDTLPAQAPLNGSLYVGRGNTLTLASHTPLINQLSFDFGAELEMREDRTQADTGYLHAIVGDFKPVLTIDPEANLVANQDEYNLMLAKTTQALTWTVSDGTNSASLVAPRAQRRNITPGARGRRRIDNLTFSLNASAGADNFTLVLP